jgi:UDP-glucuronate 4-epimerase
MMRILVTGSAGFIGQALALELLRQGHEVIGLDNLNDYYDVGLKRARLAPLLAHPQYHDYRVSLEDAPAIEDIFSRHQPVRVVNLAAQAGVRYSLKNPGAYISANVQGFLVLLEACRHHGVEHLVYASSSSVYGATSRLPFSEQACVDHPVSLYAASKKSNELMAHAYSHLFGLPTTGLRFFTVYGPWGRPDMALSLFAQRILAGEPIEVFNHGHHRRDFTYISDVIEGVVRVLDRPPRGDPHWTAALPDPASSTAPYRLYNIGNSRPVTLLRCIELLEECLGKRAIMKLLPLQPGDVLETEADVSALVRDVGYKPATPLETGIARFADWYREYHGRP